MLSDGTFLVITGSNPPQHTKKMNAADQRMIGRFRGYLKVEKGLAALTVAAYKSELTRSAEHLERRRRDLLQARREDVRAFLSQLFANTVKDRSVARKLSELRHFYKYLLLDRLIEHDPTLDIDSPRQWKVLPKSLAETEIDSMLKAVKASDHSSAQPAATALHAAIAQRDRAMLELLYAAGLRVSELVHVKLADLTLELGYVLVRGKRDKERLVPLGRAAQAAIRGYMAEG